MEIWLWKWGKKHSPATYIAYDSADNNWLGSTPEEAVKKFMESNEVANLQVDLQSLAIGETSEDVAKDIIKDTEDGKLRELVQNGARSLIYHNDGTWTPID